jgi:cyanophycinase-like exopeptidase
MPGPLALIGSGEFTSATRSVDTLLLAQASASRVLVVPAAAAADGPDAAATVVRAAQEHFGQLDAEVVVSAVRCRDDARCEQPQFDDVDLIYLPGGKVGYLAEALVGTPYFEGLIGGWRRGVPLAAASAGAVVLGSWVYDPEVPHARARQGAGLVDAAVIPHWQEVSRAKPEFVARVHREQPQVLTLDEDTAAVHGGDGWMVTGRGGVLLGSGGRLWPLAHDGLPPQRWPALI